MGGKMFYKIISFLLGGISFELFLAGVVLSISNYQRQLIPDSHPLDPGWLIWLFFGASVVTLFLAKAIWPEKEIEAGESNHSPINLYR